eukprot:Sspe_Gene.34188::Locus_16635_Transcript_1_1_Confidence_1.000_Length_1143::g.34188::m.34188
MLLYLLLHLTLHLASLVSSQEGSSPPGSQGNFFIKGYLFPPVLTHSQIMDLRDAVEDDVLVLYGMTEKSRLTIEITFPAEGYAELRHKINTTGLSFETLLTMQQKISGHMQRQDIEFQSYAQRFRQNLRTDPQLEVLYDQSSSAHITAMPPVDPPTEKEDGLPAWQVVVAVMVAVILLAGLIGVVLYYRHTHQGNRATTRPTGGRLTDVFSDLTTAGNGQQSTQMSNFSDRRKVRKAKKEEDIPRESPPMKAADEQRTKSPIQEQGPPAAPEDPKENLTIDLELINRDTPR